jgi:hypothetical protein
MKREIKREKKGASKKQEPSQSSSHSSSAASDSEQSAVVKRRKTSEVTETVAKAKVMERSTPENAELTIILDQVCLETGMTKFGMELLNSDDHRNLI